MKYAIKIKNTAKKQLSKLPKNITIQLRDKIRLLSSNQTHVGSKKLKGQKNQFRIRHGKYRIIYSVDNDELIIMVLRVGHRQNFYRDS